MLKWDLKTSVHSISLLLSERQVNMPLPYPTSPPSAMWLQIQSKTNWITLSMIKTKKILEALSYFCGPLKHYVNTQSKSPVSFLAEQLKSWFPGKGSSLLWNHFWKMPQKQARLKLSLCVSTGQNKPHSLHCNIFHQMNKWKTSDFCSVTSTFRFLFRKKWKKIWKMQAKHHFSQFI